MVHPDPFDHHSGDKNHPSKVFALASPQDRLAAVVVDYLVLIPVMSLVLAPLKRALQTQLILGDDFFFHFQTILAIVVIFATGVLYQTFFVWKYGATPGKRLLRLRVVSIWPNHKLTVGDCLLRALIWWVELFAFCVPFLSVFSDFKRRPLHDRTGDTLVITHRWNGVGTPSVVERGLARGFSHAMVLFAAFVVSFNAIEMFHELHQEANDSSEISDECQAGDDAPITDPHANLDHAMGLFAVGQYSATCLEKAADLLLAKAPDSGIGYLAKSFALAGDDAAQSDQYLAEVCKVDAQSDSCRFSQIVSSWNELDWQSVSSKLAALLPSTHDYINFWSVRHFYKIREYSKVLEILNTAPAVPAYADFVLKHRYQSLWQIGQAEKARTVFQTQLQYLDNSQRLGPANWFCQEELSQTCSKDLPESCRLFSQLTKGKEAELLTTPELALTKIRIDQCANDHFDYSAPYLEELPEQAQIYVRALKLYSRSKFSAARRVMEKLASDPNANAISIEARLELISWAHDVAEFSIPFVMWKNQDPFSQGWIREGRALMKKFSSFQLFDQSFAVGMELYNHNMQNPDFMQQLMVASYKSHHTQEALEIWRHNVSPNESRAPASVNEMGAIQRWIHAHTSDL